MKFILHLLIFSALCASCKTLISKRYHFNEEFKFKSKAEFFEYLQSKKGFDLNNVIYIDSNNVNEFISLIQNRHLVEYYGTLVNDSTEIKKSGKLEENLSCMGRILDDIESNVKGLPDTLMYVRNDFHKFKFRQVITGKPFDYYSSEKPIKIILLYSYAYGTYFDPFLKTMNKFYQEHKDKIETYIISLDYSYYFK